MLWECLCNVHAILSLSNLHTAMACSNFRLEHNTAIHIYEHIKQSQPPCPPPPHSHLLFKSKVK